MIRFFFLRHKEKTRVFNKDSRAEARCESFQEKDKMGVTVIKTTKKKQNGLKNCLNGIFLDKIVPKTGCET
jgi:hypothetical protein